MTAATGDLPDTPRAPDQGWVSDVVIRHIERTCRRAIDGRQASRALAEWSRRFELSEPEFQLLWCLRPIVDGGLDQTTLARRLAASPAQISATVERARTKGWIGQQSAQGDRRRHLWRLTDVGRELLARMIQAAASLHSEPVTESDVSLRETAA